MQTIFKRRNPEVQELFLKAGRPEKVMCVALDYAKKEHTAIICNGDGKQLRGRFDVHNNRERLTFLLGIVNGLCRKQKIQLHSVFFGGEDCGPYALNFIHALVSRSFLVVGFHASHVKHERENSRASTDLIDTIGIAGMMIKMRGRTIGIGSEDVHLVKKLRAQRRALLKAHAASAHRIHGLVDQLFPGFLDDKLSGITPFGRASLWLMQERFSAAEIHARKSPSLTRKLRDFRLQDPQGAVEKLKALAEIALPPPSRLTPTAQRCLRDELAQYTDLSRRLHALDSDIAKDLARTPGAMLTTMPGISLRWAPGLYSELADPLRRRGVKSMAALAGIVPGVKQTGGRDKKGFTQRRTRQCNHRLKHIILGTAVSVARFGDADMRTAYETDQALGRDARMRMARRCLRICLSTLDHHTFYLPPSLHQHASREQLRTYYARIWPRVLVKWRDFGAIREALAEGAPLENWRQMAEELYDLKLTTKSPQTGRK